MEISQFARQVLWGTCIADKLHRPDVLTDACPRDGGKIPSRPGRPRGLELVERKHPGARFPTQAALANPAARGLAFHFFANHELLALELMAVALLRFDDAPSAFRRQVANAMLEEQEHLAAYLEHMPGYGVAFGDVTVSPFFWNALAGMASPLEYVAGMSLTFEQANLDFAARFRDAFAAVEDRCGAAVLQKVLDDEIGHVRMGVAWLRRWGDPEQSDFERHQAALAWPLHVARAKGDKRPLVEVRKRAGLSQDYIDALSCVRSSKGRAPVLWAFNPGYERELSKRGAFCPSKMHRAVEEDFGFLLTYLATSGDVVGLAKLPSLPFLKALQSLDFAEAELCAVPSWPAPWPARVVQASKLAGLRSWGPSAAASTVFGAFCGRSVQALPDERSREASARLSRKTEAGRLEQTFLAERQGEWGARVASQGFAFQALEALEGAVAGVAPSGALGWVLKAPWGSAGQQQQRVLDGALSIAQRGWVQRVLKEQGQVRVEPWLRRRLDLSARFSALEGGVRRLTGLSRMLCDARGSFLGHVIGPLGKGLPTDLIDFLYSGGKNPRWIAKLYQDLCGWIFSHVEYRAYQGPLSMDALVADGPAGFYLRPMLEINARYTMGHVADALASRVQRSASGLWLHLRTRDVQDAGFVSFREAAKGLPTAVERQGTSIARGRMWTSDPAQAQTLCTVLVVDATLPQALTRLGPLAPVMRRRILEGSGDLFAP